MVVNLLEEIKKELRYHDKTIKDIEGVFCCRRFEDIVKDEDEDSYRIARYVKLDLNTFIGAAARYDYDTNYGEYGINTSLLLLGKENLWRITVEEYDGATWFVYSEVPNSDKIQVITDADAMQKLFEIGDDWG